MKHGGRYKDGRKIHDGYIKIWMPEHPRSLVGYVYEHRFIMEQYLGRYLESCELVHHINGDRQDNRLENLEIVNRANHALYHRMERYKEGRR